LLILVLIPGIGTVRNGSRSWFGIGSFGIQPSEFTKLGLIIFTSKYLSNNPNSMKNFKKGVLPILAITIIIFGIIMLQPDFGTGLVIVLSSIIMLFIVGVPLKYFMGLLLIGIIGLTGLIISAPYRLERILSFIDPWRDPLGSGFQGIQSILAVAPSGLFGLGFNKSIQKHFFLPEPQNDFIFAIICEEMGLIGSVVLVLLYICLLRKSIKISIKSSNLYYSFLSLNIGISIFIQTIINICVVIGLLPITGITLPLVSYGGSSLVITLVGLGILLNISRHKEEV
jgi:cell division protein FtsW